MGGLATGGFDVLVEATEDVCNAGLELASLVTPAAETEREINLADPIDAGLLGGLMGGNDITELTYRISVTLERAQIEFTDADDELVVTLDLEDSSSAERIPTDGEEQAFIDQLRLRGINDDEPIQLRGTISYTAPLATDSATALGPGGVNELGTAIVAEIAGAPATVNLEPLTGLTGLNTTSATNAIDDALAELADSLAEQVGSLVLTRPVPNEIAGMEAKVLDAAAAESARALCIGLNVFEDVGSFDGLAALAGLSDLSVVVSNLLLFRFIENALRQTLDDGTFSVDDSVPSLTWTGSHEQAMPESEDIWAPETATITKVKVEPASEGVGLTLSGEGDLVGQCYTATFTFSQTFGIECGADSALVDVVMSDIEVETEVEIDWVCVALVIGAAFVAGAVLGGIVGAIIGALVTPEAGGAGAAPGWLIGALIGGAIGGATGLIAAAIGLYLVLSEDHTTGVDISGLVGVGPLERLPLPIGTEALAVLDCELDDLELSGRPILTDCIPIASEGRRALEDGQTIDLDSQLAPRRTGIRDLAGLLNRLVTRFGDALGTQDLRVGSGSITALDGARIARTSLPYSELTLADLQSLTYSESVIALARRGRRPIPRTFAVKTSEGRYARCQATARVDGQTTLVWRTYDDPRADVLLTTRISVTGERTLKETKGRVITVSDGSDSVLGTTTFVISRSNYTTKERAQQAIVEALPLRLKPTHRYRWRVNGQTIPDSAGTTTISGAGTAPGGAPTPVAGGGRLGGGLTVRHFGPRSRRLVISSGEGTDLSASVCGEVTDADGRVIEKCTSLRSPSRTTEFGKPIGGASFEDTLNTRPLPERDLDPGIPPPRGPDPDPSPVSEPSSDPEGSGTPRPLAKAISDAMG
jgi:hypothetical protein